MNSENFNDVVTATNNHHPHHQHHNNTSNLKTYSGLGNGHDTHENNTNKASAADDEKQSATPIGNGQRRDSNQAWTPLLQKNGNSTNAGANSDDNLSLDEGLGAVGGDDENQSVLYAGTVSNNNEELKNLKNEIMHHSPLQSNNNGSLVNGKNGIGHNDKYDELDPLTGLYKQKHDAEESDLDSERPSESEKRHDFGLFGCRPKWASSLASTHVFMVVFLVAYILQGMYMTYFVSVITTIEKLFQIKSKTTGFLLSASEMGQISTAMLLTYYAGRGHRPRWIACGMVLFSIAAFACALPHFIFGKDLLQQTALLTPNNGPDLRLQEDLMLMNHNATHTSSLSLMSSQQQFDLNLCVLGNQTQNSSAECNEDRKLEQASHSKITIIVLCIFFASLLSSGIGQTAVFTLGIPYIDDNVASKQSPMYMAITIGVRILGPASGFIVGSFCTRWYVNFSDPGFDASDPRWIGAWWLGPVAIGSLMLLSSIAMFSFPRQLRGKKTSPATATGEKGSANETDTKPEEKPRLRDFPKTVRRQLSNDILMFRTASCVFHLLPIAGLYTFLPKYLETQFRLAPYDANMIAAFCGILVMGIGIVISGLVILIMKPTAKSVAAWIALTALVYSAGMVILMFIGCNMNDFAGYKPSNNLSPATIEPACSSAHLCSCDKEQFAPICGVDGKIYISSCHAGCSSSGRRPTDNHTIFSNCSCIPDDAQSIDTSFEAVSGYCDSNCKNFIVFIIIFAICVFMHSTSDVGSVLLVMRCTHPKDKAMAMGVIQSAVGLFGNVPCPIIYGAVVDSACLIWKSVCGKHGACSLYDADTFRYYFLGITAGIMFLAFIMDLVVWSKAHRIDIALEQKKNDDDDEAKSNETDYKKAPVSPDTRV